MEGLTLPSGLPWGGVATGDRSPYWPCAYPRKGKSNISVKLHKSCPNVLHIIECCRHRCIPVWEQSRMKSPLLIWCLWAVPGALVTLGASSNTCSTRKYGKRNSLEWWKILKNMKPIWRQRFVLPVWVSTKSYSSPQLLLREGSPIGLGPDNDVCAEISSSITGCNFSARWIGALTMLFTEAWMALVFSDRVKSNWSNASSRVSMYVLWDEPVATITNRACEGHKSGGHLSCHQTHLYKQVHHRSRCYSGS